MLGMYSCWYLKHYIQIYLQVSAVFVLVVACLCIWGASAKKGDKPVSKGDLAKEIEDKIEALIGRKEPNKLPQSLATLLGRKGNTQQSTVKKPNRAGQKKPSHPKNTKKNQRPGSTNECKKCFETKCKEDEKDIKRCRQQAREECRAICVSQMTRRAKPPKGKCQRKCRGALKECREAGKSKKECRKARKDCGKQCKEMKMKKRN